MPENNTSEEINLYKASTEELWNKFQELLDEEDENGNTLMKEYTEDYEKVKDGYKVKIPIWYITMNWYEEHPESRKIIVKGYGKYDVKDFMTEKDSRERTMRKIIIENTDNTGFTTPRESEA